MYEDFKTVTIIGHGPAVLENDLSEEIDSSDCVIRMIECDWHPVEKLGEKYTIGIYSPGPSAKLRDKMDRIPDLEFWYYNPTVPYPDRPDYYTNRMKPRDSRVLRKTIWSKASFQHHHVSRGTAALIAVTQLMPNIEDVFLVGFSAVMSGEFSEKHHPTIADNFLQEHLSSLPKQNTHEWAYEKELITPYIQKGLVKTYENNF